MRANSYGSAGSNAAGRKEREIMKITVKNGEEILISREDAVSIADKGGAYEVIYADETGQLVYKGEGIKITLE